jgi:hypothetical protein
MQYITTEILITEMGVSNEAKSVIPLKFLPKIKKNFFLLRTQSGDIMYKKIVILVQQCALSFLRVLAEQPMLANLFIHICTYLLVLISAIAKLGLQTERKN